MRFKLFVFFVVTAQKQRQASDGSEKFYLSYIFIKISLLLYNLLLYATKRLLFCEYSVIFKTDDQRIANTEPRRSGEQPEYC